MSNVKRTTITLPAGLYKRAEAAMAKNDYTSFSDYVQALIRADAPALPVEEMQLNEEPETYGKKPSSPKKRTAAAGAIPILKRRVERTSDQK